jgi:hypothetical protein
MSLPQNYAKEIYAENGWTGGPRDKSSSKRMVVTRINSIVRVAGKRTLMTW